MGLSSKAKSSNEGWGLGLLLVFFPDEEDNTNTNNNNNKRKSNNSSSNNNSSNGKWSYISPFGTTSTSLIYSRAQSTLSICVVIVFFTLFLFTLSTFDRTVPSISPSLNPRIDFPRRWLSEKNNNHSEQSNNKKQRPPTTTTTFALQGLGTQFRRGTRAMSDLVVAHITEDTRAHHLRLFLRTLHRSGLTSKADVLFIFPNSQSPNFTSLILQENQSFSTLIHQSTHTKNYSSSSSSSSTTTTTKPRISSNFDATHFTNKNKHGGTEPIWGPKQHRINNNQTESTRLSWGSIVGFEAAELDPENSLAGFTDNHSDPPMRLRRWACYPMLLGRLRRNFKHVLLADVKEVVVLGDPLARVRTRSAESVSVWAAPDHSTHRNRPHGRRRESSRSVSADVIAGGMRGIRRLSGTVLNEIVRAAARERRGKGGVSDSAALSQLVRSESLLKSVNVVVTESTSYDSVRMVSGGGDVGSVILKEICGATRESFNVYSDC